MTYQTEGDLTVTRDRVSLDGYLTPNYKSNYFPPPRRWWGVYLAGTGKISKHWVIPTTQDCNTFCHACLFLQITLTLELNWLPIQFWRRSLKKTPIFPLNQRIPFHTAESEIQRHENSHFKQRTSNFYEAKKIFRNLDIWLFLLQIPHTYMDDCFVTILPSQWKDYQEGCCHWKVVFNLQNPTSANP